MPVANVVEHIYRVLAAITSAKGSVTDAATNIEHTRDLSASVAMGSADAELQQLPEYAEAARLSCEQAHEQTTRTEHALHRYLEHIGAASAAGNPPPQQLAGPESQAAPPRGYERRVKDAQQRIDQRPDGSAPARGEMGPIRRLVSPASTAAPETTTPDERDGISKSTCRPKRPGLQPTLK